MRHRAFSNWPCWRKVILPHVGNDIVDLTDSASKKKSRNTRFLNRVFTPDEKSVILSSAFPDLLLWALWAAKEAAYKAISKEFPDIPSIPRLFPVFLDPHDSADFPPESRIIPFSGYSTGTVLTPEGTCWIRIDYRPACLHCVAFTDVPDHLISSWRVHYLFAPRQTASSPESEAVRLASRLHLAGFLEKKFEDLEIIRGNDGHSQAPPRVICQGRPLDVDISLSHHGLFIAHACLKHYGDSSLSP